MTKSESFDALTLINKQAAGEGWFISQTSGVPENYRLEKDDEAGIFTSDHAVWRNLLTRRSRGDHLAMMALNWLQENSPKEYNEILMFSKRLEG